MDFALTEEQQMLRDGAERYLADNYDFKQRRALLDSGTALSEPIWQSFAEFGWLSLSLPEEAGGLGCSFVETVLLGELLGRYLVLEPYTTNAVLCARLVERSSLPGRVALLTALASGQLRLALAHGELESRYSNTNIKTTARAKSDGYILSGRKVMVLDATVADRLIVSAVMQDGGGLALFLVDREVTGLARREYRLIDGTRGADIDFDSVSVGKDARLAGAPQALALLEEAVDRTIVARVAETLGAMEMIMQLTAEHIRNRVQFGQPLARFQALQHRMAEMFVEVQETRSILYRALASLESSPAERTAAVSAAKVVSAHAGKFVREEGVQLHGGVGVTEEYQVGHYFRRLMTLEKSFGDAAWHLQRLTATYGAQS
jgi:alkylation response protein AidB-like acyl-CoA dehydrogenase